jgi:hypothetical protein
MSQLVRKYFPLLFVVVIALLLLALIIAPFRFDPLRLMWEKLDAYMPNALQPPTCESNLMGTMYPLDFSCAYSIPFRVIVSGKDGAIIYTVFYPNDIRVGDVLLALGEPIRRQALGNGNWFFQWTRASMGTHSPAPGALIYSLSFER